MDPQVALKLSTNRGVSTLIKYLIEEMKTLNSLEDLALSDPKILAIEIKARKLAFEKIKEVIDPILNVKGVELQFRKDEYLVDVKK